MDKTNGPIVYDCRTLEKVMKTAHRNKWRVDVFHIFRDGMDLDIIHPQKDYALVKNLNHMQHTFIHPYGSSIGYKLHDPRK